MYALLRPIRFAAFAAFTLALTGCATMNVSSYLERGSDFTRYRTYSWAAADPQDTGDPRLDNNPFFHDRIRADVEKELAARGFEKATSDVPDLQVHYHASVRQRADLNSIDRELGNCVDKG